MKDDLFSKHEETLDNALQAIKTRGYWTAFSEMPDTRVYGEASAKEGEAAFKAQLDTRFVLDQPGFGWVGEERSPFGFPLNIEYPKAEPDALILVAQKALGQYRKAGPKAWVGVSLEIVARLNPSRYTEVS
ncbi:hypothetical protein [Burkholderia sp. S171]|uniref:hypothetical protein n=1 Tax=Burkholderia sp. S171 TaxID=1641860 RepID=UPI00131D812E